MVNRKTSLISITMFFIIVVALWGFLYTKTVFASTFLSYASFVVLFALSLAVLIRYNFGSFSSFSIVWCPYLLYTIVGYLIGENIQSMTSWISCLIILLVSTKVALYNNVPYKVFYWSGIIALIGIYVQLFYPQFYYTRISVIFQSAELLERWEEKGGLAGFSYQTGMTAAILLYSEVVVLYLRESISRKLLRNDFLYYLLLVITIIGVFLTGKRMLSVIAIVLPFIIFLFSTKNGAKVIVCFVLMIVITILLGQFFITHLNQWSDTFLFKRFVESYFDLQGGGDITSGRDFLYNMAIRAYEENPNMGIGVGNFYNLAGTEVHNTYLQVLCEQGLWGFIAFVVPIIYCLFGTLQLIKSDRRWKYRPYLLLSFALQLVYVFYAFTGNVNVGLCYIVYYIGIGILISIPKQHHTYNLV